MDQKNKNKYGSLQTSQLIYHATNIHRSTSLI